jgi:hypothetical protein
MPERYQINNITLTHDNNYVKHKSEFELVLRILPTRRIYSAIYNNFMKKLIAEEYSTGILDNWYSNPVFWHDRCYHNIVEYYGLITQDIHNNLYPLVVDFDQLLNKDYLSDILARYFQVEFNDSRESIRKTYQELQLIQDLDQDRTSMKDITDVVTDDLLAKNPWFFSYCIHKYETSNNLTQSNRCWSINNISQCPSKKLLFDLAQQYQ